MKNLFAVKQAIPQKSVLQQKESAIIVGGLRFITNSERVFQNKMEELNNLGIEYRSHQENMGNGQISWQLEW